MPRCFAILALETFWIRVSRSLGKAVRSHSVVNVLSERTLTPASESIGCGSASPNPASLRRHAFDRRGSFHPRLYFEKSADQVGFFLLMVSLVGVRSKGGEAGGG